MNTHISFVIVGFMLLILTIPAMQINFLVGALFLVFGSALVIDFFNWINAGFAELPLLPGNPYLAFISRELMIGFGILLGSIVLLILIIILPAVWNFIIIKIAKSMNVETGLEDKETTE